MKIKQEIIDRILEAARIEDVIGDFVTLKKKGVRYMGLCPFHEDKHATNFSVYPKKNCFTCFACGAKGGVVDFLMRHARLSYPDAIRYLGKKYSIDTDMKDFNYTPPPPKPAPPPLPTLTLPMWMVAAKENVDQDVLAAWIKTIRWDAAQRSRINQVFGDYHLGHSTIDHNRRDGSVKRNEFTVFWQIDDKSHVRTGHLMKYNPDGHRVKREQDKYNTDWIHAILKGYRDQPPYPYPQYFDPDKQEKRNTLFGMHLVNKYPHATVCIVESEKTAILMAIAYGNYQRQIWMACAGIQNLSRETIQPLIDRRLRIVLYPDRDGIDTWRQKCEQLHYDNMTVDATPVTKWWCESDGRKADIADVVIRMVNESNPLTTIDEVKTKMPQAKTLIEKLNLQIENERTQTENKAEAVCCN